MTVQDAIERMPPFEFVAVRFGMAAAVLALLGGARGLSRREARHGAIMGVPMFAGYALQTVGLQYTTPSNAGFITGLFVVFTPLVGAALLRRIPSSAALLGVLLATVGLLLLAMPSGFAIARGDTMILGTAVAFSFHIVAIGTLGEGLSAFRLTTVQVATTAALSALWSVASEPLLLPSGETVWTALLVTALVATALGFFVQTRAQQEISPTRTAVILTVEPVFAGIFGFLWAGDRLGARGYAGAALIVAGILVAELLAPTRERV